MRLSSLALCFVLISAASLRSGAIAQNADARSRWKADLETAISDIELNYAYHDHIDLDWVAIRTRYLNRLGVVKTDHDFFHLIEQLHDHHVILNRNDQDSYRLIPTSIDIWIEFSQGDYVVTDVRPESNASLQGVSRGEVVLAVNGVAIDEAVERRLRPFFDRQSELAKSWAARTLVAGTHRQDRIQLNLNSVEKGDVEYDLMASKPIQSDELLTHKELDENIHYLRIENSLGDRRLLKKYDEILDSIESSCGIILDLRETPSGGDSDIARGLMGRLISRELPFQKHEFLERPLMVPRVWLECVRPRGRSQFNGKLVVLCGRWTGSMGEGIVVGLDGMKRATIVGSKMAGLKGAIYQYELKHAGFRFSLPAEKLSHIDGTPREQFEPTVKADEGDAGDPCISTALRLLSQAIEGTKD